MSKDPFAQDADAFLSGGAPAQKFPHEGFEWTATVMSWEMAQKTDLDSGDLKFWADGKPVMQLVMTLQGEATGFKYEGNSYKKVAIPDDDGIRRLFISGNMRNALSAAIKKASSKLEQNAQVTMMRGTDIPATKKGYSGRHTFSAIWEPAATNAAAVEGFLDGAEDEDNGNPF